MGFISSMGHALGTAVQGTSDILFNGPEGIEMRQELDSLHSQVNDQIKQYNDVHSQISAWQNPLNNCGKYTSALLHQSSDYVHGIAFNYSEIITDNSLNIPNITQLGKANVVKPIVDIPIPGDFGGFPSALIPGVEALKMIEGLINVFGSSITLSEQLSKARKNLHKARSYVSQEQRLLGQMQETSRYFLEISNNILNVFRRTTGLNLPNLTGSNPSELASTVTVMEHLITQLTDVKGNAFRICRFIVNLAKEKNISSPTSTQINWIASTLFTAIPNMSSSFNTEANVVTFVSKFFSGSLLTPAILLHLPDPPADIKQFITESAPSHQTMSDPNSSQYDPPSGIDLNNFPS